jgi:hypothetical protein
VSNSAQQVIELGQSALVLHCTGTLEHAARDVTHVPFASPCPPMQHTVPIAQIGDVGSPQRRPLGATIVPASRAEASYVVKPASIVMTPASPPSIPWLDSPSDPLPSTWPAPPSP